MTSKSSSFYAEWLNFSVEVLKSKSVIEFVPYSQAYEPGFDDMRRRKPVVEKLGSTIGFCPTTPLRTIIERTVQATL